MANSHLLLAAQTTASDAGLTSIVWPLAILAVGVAIVLGSILVLRLNAFMGLILAALTVSLLAPGAIDQKAVRIADAFGATAGKIGIVIAMAAVIGAAMTASGAADRIVRAFVASFGQERAGGALAASGFVLSIPVFFDTVFYLLMPLARSMYRRTRRHYVKYIVALGAGGTATHSLVPPTPGPLYVAADIGVNLGLMIVIGAAVALPATLAGLAFASWIDRRLSLTHPPLDDALAASPVDEDLPGLWSSLAPILMPVVLIAGSAIVSQIAPTTPLPGAPPAPSATTEEIGEARPAWARTVQPWLAVVGNPNVALMISAALAIGTYLGHRRPTRLQVTALVEESLASAGVIILITAAGGAFGAMLKQAQVGEAIRDLMSGEQATAGYGTLLLAFVMASALKIAQGSSTVAMMTTSGMIAAMLQAGVPLGFHPVYLATAIGSGAIVASWMNDSGFWVVCKMSGLTERECIKTWTMVTGVVGLTGFAATLAMAWLLPLN